jgi:DNA topoisomerase IB
MQEVADHLGNTAAVARASYVDQRVIDRFRDGRTIAAALARVERGRGRSADRPDLRVGSQEIVERAVLRLLA